MSVQEGRRSKDEAELSRVAAAWLLIVAATCGGVIMAIELLGARMLSASFGGSLTVWAAMISVTLMSLAIGYFVGGYLADRSPRSSILYAVLIVAAVLTAAGPHARFVLRSCRHALGVRTGALASSAVIFFLPLGLLAITSPFVIRLLAHGKLGVGVTAGSVYAISTVGSVAGTLLTGLWLIPQFGTAASFRMAAVVVAAAGALGFLFRFRPWGAIALLVPALVLLAPRSSFAVGQSYIAPDGDRVEVCDVQDSAYGRIAILRKGAYKLLLINGIVQSGVPTDLDYMGKGALLADHYFQELLPYMVDDPSSSDVLLIGLAGGMTASLLMRYDMHVDSVELDPKAIEIARRHFSFRGPAVAADGRCYLEDCAKRYDFCVIDTYSGDVFPFHMASVEAFRAARGVLRPGGVLAINFIGSPNGQAFACVCKTVGSVFENVQAIKGEAGDDVQTITIFASDRPIEFNNGWLQYMGDFTGVDPIADLIDELTIWPDRADGFILSDDHNPIDFMRMKEAVRWRERTEERIGSGWGL